eukprot:Seg2013.1 transcript_id=Seg2013.1/GoldUCD/mRNA.D3Y31 product="hypothetical protein" protein_id=Seg2013.1/GoldUCD/D3Y31
MAARIVNLSLMEKAVDAAQSFLEFRILQPFQRSALTGMLQGRDIFVFVAASGEEQMDSEETPDNLNAEVNSDDEYLSADEYEFDKTFGGPLSSEMERHTS